MSFGVFHVVWTSFSLPLNSYFIIPIIETGNLEAGNEDVDDDHDIQCLKYNYFNWDVLIKPLKNV